MKPLVISVGEIFGRLTVTEVGLRNSRGDQIAACQCTCGKRTLPAVSDLRNGSTRSCGCSRMTSNKKRSKDVKKRNRHGMSTSSEYKIWSGMVQRCTNPNVGCFHRYGERGITICQEWRNSFTKFYAHIGPRPSAEHSIDRIDNNLGYEPGNVRWATKQIQCINRNDIRLETINGITQSLSQWEECIGISRFTLYDRRSRGIHGEALIVPVYKGRTK
jgi:hypothetical protein